MKNTFTGISIIIMICAAIHMVMTARGKGRLAGQILAIQMASVFTALLYCITLFAQRYEVAMLFFGLFFASFDWLLFFILDFTLTYIGANRKTKFFKVFIILYSILSVGDFVSMCVNPFTQHVFVLHENAPSVMFDLRVWESTGGFPFQLHMILCYIMAVHIAAELIYKFIHSPKDFKTPYILDLAVVATVLLSNLIQLYIKIPLNICTLLYMLYGIWVYYFVYYVVPSEAERSMQIYVGRELDSAIACFDMDNHCIRANRATRTIFGTSGNDFTAIESYAKQWLEANPENTPDLITGEDIIEIEGREHIFTQEFRRLRDSKGHTQGSYLKLVDRTKELSRVREQKERATHDSLTGMLNRSAFFEKATQIIQSNPDIPRYMVATNIKDFKLINDLFGQEFANRILLRQSELISHIPYEDYICGRIGADRFAMLIAKADFKAEEAIQGLNQVQEVAADMQYSIRTQCGVYEIANPKENVQQMYDRALMAVQKLHDSDEQLAYYDTFMMEELIHKKNILAEFDHALEDGQFCMYLQPQMNRDGVAVGAEALVRWIHPEKGLIPPYQFIPVLEDTGLIYRLDRYIWELAAKKLAQWKKQGVDAYISVNISTKDFYYADLYVTFTSLMKQYSLDPSRLKLEITETALLHGEDHMNVLKHLGQEGFCIEMDDFGSGYSSLNLLKTTHMNVLKVDMEFLRRTQNPDRAKIIVGSIIRMAKKLGMEVITEGVEEQEHADFLVEAGCDYLQGYFFSKPIPVAEFEEKYIKEGHL